VSALREIRPGLRRWETPHPEWGPEEAEGGGWEEVVASYALTTDETLVLLDPLAPPPGSAAGDELWAELDSDVERLGPPHVLITIFWHARSSREIAERYEGTSVWANEPAADLVRERTPLTDTFRPGDDLPGGVVPYDAGRAYEVVFWLPTHAAVVVGDVLLGADAGRARLCPPSWLGGGKTHDDLRRALQPLLELPVELLLLTHGEAISDGAHEALARATA
jgi:hypothetical protein